MFVTYRTWKLHGTAGTTLRGQGKERQTEEGGREGSFGAPGGALGFSWAPSLTVDLNRSAGI